MNNGVPLGGIGAGKLEVFPNGCIGNFTFLNNPDRPLGGRDGVLGYHFGVYAKIGSRRIAKLLQTSSLGDYPTIQDVEYKGDFPFVRIRYIDKELPFRLELNGGSIFIPHKSLHSSLPCAILLFEIENLLDYEIDGAIIIMGRNIVGDWEVGRFNKVIKEKNHISLLFSTTDIHPYNESAGELSLSILKGEYELSYIEGWDMQIRPFIFDENDIYLMPWGPFKKTGKLPDTNFTEILQSESRQLGGSLCCSLSLRPKQRARIPCFITWHFPNHRVGHIYERTFKDASFVTRHLLRTCTLRTPGVRSFFIGSWQNLHIQTEEWHRLIVASELQDWLKDALLNNLYPLLSSSLWSRSDEFSIAEAPVICPLMGTLDVRYYGSIPLALLFPELELNEFIQFVKAQRADGYIPHDLGRKQVNHPSNGTTPYFWKDLNPKFILIAYRDWLWLKDKRFLHNIYPAVKRAFHWILATDKNGDSLPDCEGQDQTYDMWALKGNVSYVSSIFLASIKALEKFSQLMKDRATEDLCHTLFLKGSKNFEEQLYNGRYFSLWRDGDERNDSCMLGQLNGQWYAHMLNLGYIVQEDAVKKAVEYILNHNCSASPYGAVNAILPDGRPDPTCQQSENIWPGECYAFAALAIYEGYKEEGLELVRKVWNYFVNTSKSPWNQPDTISASSGDLLFGDHYMRNMAIWAILFALQSTEPGAKSILEYFLTAKAQNVR